MLGATFGENNTDADDPIAVLGVLRGARLRLQPEVRGWACATTFSTSTGRTRGRSSPPAIIYAPLQSFKLQLSASIDSNPTNAATGKANANTTATLSATLHF